MSESYTNKKPEKNMENLDKARDILDEYPYIDLAKSLKELRDEDQKKESDY